MSITNAVLTANAWMVHRPPDVYYRQKWQDLSEIISSSLSVADMLHNFIFRVCRCLSDENIHVYDFDQ